MFHDNQERLLSDICFERGSIFKMMSVCLELVSFVKEQMKFPSKRANKMYILSSLNKSTKYFACCRENNCNIFLVRKKA